jgi:hypothetical protein
MTGITIRLKKKDKHIIHVSQTVVPRVGELIWLHSNIDLNGDSEMNTHKILKKFGTTTFKVVKVCHWMNEHLDNCDRVMVYVKKVKM